MCRLITVHGIGFEQPPSLDGKVVGYAAGSIPVFDDQPHYEAMSLQVSVGATSEIVLGVAKEVAADLIVLEWDANLGPGRATVVRQVVGHSHVAVLLLRSRGAGPPPYRA